MTKRERRIRRFEIKVPATYKAPLRRPSETWDFAGAIAWDQTTHWITAPEWLAWLRRRGPRRTYVCYGRNSGGKWVPRPRPQIEATIRPMSNLKRSKLP